MGDLVVGKAIYKVITLGAKKLQRFILVDIKLLMFLHAVVAFLKKHLSVPEP
jgi:hypothetical protein